MVVVRAVVANVVLVTGTGATDVEEEECLTLSITLATHDDDVLLVVGSTLVETKTVRVAIDLVME